MDKVKLIETVSRGSHVRKIVDPELVIGDASNGYVRGCILDANAVIDLVTKMVENGITIPGIITSEQISDGTINLEDLSDEVKDKL